MSPSEYTSSNWFGKASAGLVLGFGLALALSALFAILMPGIGGGKLQVTMWIVSPMWVTILSFCFLFRNGRAAWGWLGLANGIAFGLLAVLQS